MGKLIILWSIYYSAVEFETPEEAEKAKTMGTIDYKDRSVSIEELKDVITGIRNVRAKMNVHPSKKSKLIFVTKKYEKVIKESEDFLKKGWILQK